MKVGEEAAEAIWKVHGKKYRVGTSPAVLCMYSYFSTYKSQV